MLRHGFISKQTGSGPYICEFKCRYIRLLIGNVVLFLLPILFLKIEQDASNLQYMLSSIAQGYATIFVLAITIPMLFTQGNSKRELIKKWLELDLRTLQLGFYTVLALTVVWPLLLLAWNNFCPLYIKLSISLALMSLYGAIESALGYKDRMEIIFGFRNKRKKRR